MKPAWACYLVRQNMSEVVHGGLHTAAHGGQANGFEPRAYDALRMAETSAAKYASKGIQTGVDWLRATLRVAQLRRKDFAQQEATLL